MIEKLGRLGGFVLGLEEEVNREEDCEEDERDVSLVMAARRDVNPCRYSSAKFSGKGEKVS